MAVPRGKVSKSKRDKRRANWKIELPGLTKCPQCQEIKLPHRVCPHCGYYKGREAVKVQ
ncbi:MAG: 50S ribosomal protein L32 [Firmicutes bacterium]|nr:50S ribosomal protein L32 [Bacillota bacterium]